MTTYQRQGAMVLGRFMNRNKSLYQTSTMTGSLSSSSSSLCSMQELRSQFAKEIEALPECRAREDLASFLQIAASSSNGVAGDAPLPPTNGCYQNEMSPPQILQTLDAAMATFHLHCESRIAALVGQCFYTIGPCGEELLGAARHCLSEHDTVALHYRHLSINLLGQLRLGYRLEDILLDRARGYTVSRHDPVTGGVHCAIGSARQPDQVGGDYVVTSTLASQCPPAVGRALGFSLADKLLEREQYPRLSFVTVGDGSVHNHHFLAAYNLAKHARYRHRKCPVVFGISDNGLCISYDTQQYTDHLFAGDLDGNVPIYRANGSDMMDVYDKTLQATRHARQYSAPAVVLYQNIVRRFGHAATDRQDVYLCPQDVERRAKTDMNASAMRQAVEVFNVVTFAELRDRNEEIGSLARAAFDEAAVEEKVTRRDMMECVSQPAVTVPVPLPSCGNDTSQKTDAGTSTGKRDVMRKHMTRVLAEVLHDNPSIVYMGEDVEHGGYYRVTEGLKEDFPDRVIDFPPDETTLLGAAIGFAQVGLTPIVEIPYAKYLDCGADMFYELAVMNWLSAGQIPNGMVIRLQGFDRGTFGGNFHTHNMLPNIPPGVDVVCYSNGYDYVRGFRNAILQAKQGRVVMVVDCTHLLNLRHVFGRDRGWEKAYPGREATGVMGFECIGRYGTDGRFAIVSYGNGVVTALQARRYLSEAGIIANESEVDVLDCPLLSDVPSGLKEVVTTYEGILFADICKDGPGGNVLSSVVTSLQQQQLLTSRWAFVGAPRTYNPLGSTVTFLNVADIAEAFVRFTEADSVPTRLSMSGVHTDRTATRGIALKESAS